jgi:hypothetical protein
MDCATFRAIFSNVTEISNIQNNIIFNNNLSKNTSNILVHYTFTEQNLFCKCIKGTLAISWEKVGLVPTYIQRKTF